jgi:hypothetical protein
MLHVELLGLSVAEDKQGAWLAFDWLEVNDVGATAARNANEQMKLNAMC